MKQVFIGTEAEASSVECSLFFLSIFMNKNPLWVARWKVPKEEPTNWSTGQPKKTGQKTCNHWLRKKNALIFGGT